MTVAIVRRAFSVHEYAQMRERGILTEDERVELIAGEIRVKCPIGPLHAAIVNKIGKLLHAQVGNRAIISVQNLIQLNDYSEPKPDIAVLDYREDYYAYAHPTPEQIMFIIEVADTSAAYECDEKIPRYAAANIPEVWLIDVNAAVIEQYTHPVRNQYYRVQKVFPGETITIASPHLPEMTLNTDNILI